MKGGNVSCEDCSATWDDDPPCNDCAKPDDLTGMNKSCFLLWKQLSRRDRPPGQGEVRPVPSKAIGDICEIYGLSIQDFERIGLIEDCLYDWMAERYSNQVAGEMENVRSTDSSRNKTGGKKSTRFRKRL